MPSRGINKVILVGNLGADPETRYTQSGSAVTRLRIATSESWKNRENGQQEERTEWHSVVGFARLAEIMGEYLRKGSKVYVEGQLRTSSWEQDGQTRYRTEIVARDMQMLDSRGGGGGGNSGGFGGAMPDDGFEPMGGGGRPAGDNAGGSRSSPPQGGAQGAPRGGGKAAPPPPAMDDDFDDDIPF